MILKRKKLSLLASHRWVLTGATCLRLAGNYLLAKAYGLTTRLGHEISQMVSRACAEGCIGSMWEIAWSDSRHRSEDQYFKIIEKKTATIYELCCRLGARLSAAPDAVVGSLATYGHNLGMAYQMTTDILEGLADGSLDRDTLSRRVGKASVFVMKAKHSLNDMSGSPAKKLLMDLAEFVIDLVPSDSYLSSADSGAASTSSPEKYAEIGI